MVIEGPYGRLHGGVRTRRKVTLLASGIGITPLRALLEQLPQGPGDVTLIYRARDERDLVFRAELDALAAAGVRGWSTPSAAGSRAGTPGCPRTPPTSPTRDALRHLVPDIAHHDVYLCGADQWMDAARTAALAAGVPADHIHLERFSW